MLATECWLPLAANRCDEVFCVHFLSLCASTRITSFLLLIFPTARLPVFSSLEAWEKTCEPNCNGSSNYALCLRCDLHDLSVEVTPDVVSWTHAPPRYMHALFLGILLDSQLRASVSWGEHCFLVPFLHGIAASIGHFLLACLMVSLYCPSSKKMPLNLWTLSNLGFSIANSCFSLLNGFSYFGPVVRQHIFRFGSCLNVRQSPLDHISFWRLPFAIMWT